jgi:adenosine deaminase
VTEGRRGRLRRYLERAPKAEVHVHLEGAVPASFLEGAARRHGLPWRGRAAAELGSRLVFDSPAGFLALFRWVLEEHFRAPEDYADGLRAVAGAFAAANVRYAEVSVSTGALLFFGRPLGEILDALTSESAAIATAGGPELRFVADGVRQHGPDPLGRVLDAIGPLPRARWPALGLAGAEASRPARDFADVFADARRAGLAADVHAGEGAGAASVRDALEHLHPDRIVHGTDAARDPELLRLLRVGRIPVALNPTSNVRTGVVSGLAAFPLRRLLAAGLRLSVNTDDPALFGVTLADELDALAAAFRLPLASVDALLLGGVDAAFLPARRRAALLEAWGAELDRLREELGLEAHRAGDPPRVVPAPEVADGIRETPESRAGQVAGAATGGVRAPDGAAPSVVPPRDRP